VSIKEDIHPVEDVTVCVIIYVPVVVTVSTGLDMVLLLNDPEGVTLQLYPVIAAGAKMVDWSVRVITPQLTFFMNFAAKFTSTNVSLHTMHTVLSGNLILTHILIIF
jgi:hypothetical protein